MLRSNDFKRIGVDGISKLWIYQENRRKKQNRIKHKNCWDKNWSQSTNWVIEMHTKKTIWIEIIFRHFTRLSRSVTSPFFPDCFLLIAFGCIHYFQWFAIHLRIGRRLQFVFITCDMHNFIRIQPFFFLLSLLAAVYRLHFVLS